MRGNFPVKEGYVPFAGYQTCYRVVGDAEAPGPPPAPFWLTGAARVRPDLPARVEEALGRHEAAGTTDSEEYQSTMMVFYDRHVCRVRPWPDWLQRTFDGLEANPEVYNTMNGPSEFHVIGPLKDFDITADLGR